MFITSGKWKHRKDLSNQHVIETWKVDQATGINRPCLIAKVAERTGETEANANLLATAPELYKALALVLNRLVDNPEQKLFHPEDLEHFEKVLTEATYRQE